MKNSVVTVIQARLGSRRLPGKVLLPLGGRTVLEVLLERVMAARLVGTVVVATTTDQRDEVIAEHADWIGVACVCGHPTDLLERHVAAGETLGAEHIVKIPSDCPLIDPVVIDEVIDTYLSHGAFDYVSNLHPPTHPDGNDVEIMSLDALTTAWQEADKPFEREHTTPFIWTRPDRFRIGNVSWSEGDCAKSHRVVLDYLDDYAVITAVYENLAPANRFFSAGDVVRFLDEHPDIAAINADRRGSAWYNEFRAELPGLDGHQAEAPAR